MNTIHDYLFWRGDLTFDQVPFNDVDAGILARFAYEPMDGIVSDNFYEQTLLKDACREMLNDPGLVDHVIERDIDPKFIWEISNCRRFSDIRLSGYVNEINTETQIQFSAVVFDINGEGDYYLGFRGTDNTLIAWKEDFNMGFEFPVPAQAQALEYLETALRKFKDGTFMIGGHSKGGNLSIYSSVFCRPEFRRAISKIYNFDGPGFTSSIMETEGYKEISSKIITYVPKFSVVGMILEHEEDYSVVDSNATGIMQHELLTWGIEPGGYDLVDDLDKGSKFLDETMRAWIGNLSKEEREVFVENIYSVVEASNATTIAEFVDNKNEAVSRMISMYSRMDSDSNSCIINGIKNFVECAKKNIRK